MILALLALLTAAPLAERPPAQRILLRAARLFDARKGTLVEPGAVLVEGSRIVKVGADAKAEPSTETIDFGDLTLLPGLIDAHEHLTFEASASWFKDEVGLLQRPVTEQSHFASAYARRVLEAGFTTVRDLGSGEYLDVGLRNAIRDGFVAGPRMLVAVNPIGARAPPPPRRAPGAVTRTRIHSPPTASSPPESARESARGRTSAATPCAG